MGEERFLSEVNSLVESNSTLVNSTALMASRVIVSGVMIIWASDRYASHRVIRAKRPREKPTTPSPFSRPAFRFIGVPSMKELQTAKSMTQHHYGRLATQVPLIRLRVVRGAAHSYEKYRCQNMCEICLCFNTLHFTD